MLPIARLLSSAFLAFDGLMSAWFQVRPFTHEPPCILRFGVGESPEDRRLADGTRIRQGEPIIELHLWNERILDARLHGRRLNLLPRVAWSLGRLAEYLEQHPELSHIKACCSDMSVARPERCLGTLADIGFTVVRRPPQGLLERALRFLQHLYSRGLAWAVNPVSFQRWNVDDLVRLRLWISTKRLRELRVLGGNLRLKRCRPQSRDHEQPAPSDRSQDSVHPRPSR